MGISADAPLVNAPVRHAQLIYTSFEGVEAEHCADKLLALSTACGWHHYDLAKWRSLLACCSELFVAQSEDGSFVGCALRTSYSVAGDEKAGFGMLGMMLVDPALRGAGIAKRILIAFEERVAALGETCAMGCATPAGLPVYLKRGYRPVTPAAICQRVAAPCSVASALSSDDSIEVALFRVGASVGAGLKQLLDLDREVTGLDRTKQLLKLSKMEGAFVAVALQGSEVVGALLSVVDSQAGTLNLGPILGTEASATKLITSVAHEFPQASMAFFVHDHHKYFESLQASGFALAPNPSTGTMVLGDAEMPGDRSKYVAVISPALG